MMVLSSPIENPNLAELIKIIDHKDSRAKKVSRSINSDRRRLEFQPDAEELEILQKVLKATGLLCKVQWHTHAFWMAAWHHHQIMCC